MVNAFSLLLFVAAKPQMAAGFQTGSNALRLPKSTAGPKPAVAGGRRTVAALAPQSSTSTRHRVVTAAAPVEDVVRGADQNLKAAFMRTVLARFDEAPRRASRGELVTFEREPM